MKPLLPFDSPSSPKRQQEPVAGSSQAAIVTVEPDKSAILLDDKNDPLWSGTFTPLPEDVPVRKRSLSPASSSTGRIKIAKGHASKTGVRKIQSPAEKAQHTALEKARRERVNDLLNALKNTLNPTTEAISEREILEQSIAFVKRTRQLTMEPAPSREIDTSKTTLKTTERVGTCQNRNQIEQQRRKVLKDLTKELEALFFPDAENPSSKETILQTCLDYIQEQKSASASSAIPKGNTDTMLLELADLLAIPDGADRVSETIRRCKLMVEQQSTTHLMKTAKETFEQQKQFDQDSLLLAIANEGNKKMNLRPTIAASQEKINQCDTLLRTTLNQLQKNNSEIKKQLMSLTYLHGRGKAKDQSSTLFESQEETLATLTTTLKQQRTLTEQHIQLEKQSAVIEGEIERLQKKLQDIQSTKSTTLRKAHAQSGQSLAPMHRS